MLLWKSFFWRSKKIWQLMELGKSWSISRFVLRLVALYWKNFWKKSKSCWRRFQTSIFNLIKWRKTFLFLQNFEWIELFGDLWNSEGLVEGCVTDMSSSVIFTHSSDIGAKEEIQAYKNIANFTMSVSRMSVFKLNRARTKSELKFFWFQKQAIYHSDDTICAQCSDAYNGHSSSPNRKSHPNYSTINQA